MSNNKLKELDSLVVRREDELAEVKEQLQTLNIKQIELQVTLLQLSNVLQDLKVTAQMLKGEQ